MLPAFLQTTEKGKTQFSFCFNKYHLKLASSSNNQGDFLATVITCFVSILYEGWNFNSGNYLFTTDTK